MNLNKYQNVYKTDINRFKSQVILGEGKKLQSILIIGKAMEKYAQALELNNELESQIKVMHYQAGIQLVELADEVDEFDEIILAVKSLEQAKTFYKSIGDRNEKLLEDYYKNKDLIPKNNLIEFGFEDFKKDPLAQIERVYENFDLDGLEVNRDIFKKYIKSQEGHKMAEHVGTLEDVEVRSV